MYPEEIEFLTSAPFWIGVGLLALLWLILRIIAKAWLMREYRKDPEALIARMERNRQRMRDDEDWDFDKELTEDDILDLVPLANGLDHNGIFCGSPSEDHHRNH